MATSDAIILENQKPGNPQSDWGLTTGAPVGNIEGYARELSVNVGEAVDFKINTNSTNYRVEIYRLGYYGGDGARLVGTIEHQSAAAPIQPAPLKDAATGLVDAGNWSVTDSWQMPDDMISGVYLAKLVRQDGVLGESRIPFIVRDDASTSDIVFQTSDTTWQAYNPWGGHSLYTGNANGGFDKAVSYNRPMALDIPEPTGTTLYGPESYLFGAEYGAIRWLEKNGYDVTYQTGIDTARTGENLLNHNIFLSVGHDEYWSGEQRENVEAARDAGVNLAFWSGNTMFWKTRHDVGMTGDPWKTIVTYKESYDGVPADPTSVWTGLWRDAAGASEGGGIPENALTGTQFAVNLGTPLTSINIPQALCGCFLWANTDVANLAPGETWTLNGNYLGYEWDVDAFNDLRPGGLIELSSTTVDVPFLLEGTNVQFSEGTATHSMTLYRDDSGALVFSAGTVFWSWALDDFHVYGPVGPYEYTPTDPNAEQAMVNLFAEMGVQPGTLSWYLSAAQQSTDRSAPVSVISGVSNGLTVGTGTTLTFNGTAADVGGGVVMAIEVSTDGGATWKPGIGGPNWSFTWTAPDTPETVTILTRAIDDKLNIEQPTKALSVNVVDPSTIPSPVASPEVPVSTITNLIDWNLVGAGEQILFTGAAIDPDGGWVGGVELSTDNGATWSAAEGTGNWAYIWDAPTTPGFYTLLYRSGDNEEHLEKENVITLSVVEPGSIVFGAAPPKSTITNIINGYTVAAGTAVKVMGTAIDLNSDGWVGGVEVSTDNGYTWNLASGTTNWSFDWNVPTTPGVYEFQYRAGDNDFNLEAARTVLVNVVDPSSIPPTSGVPVSAATNLASGDSVAAGQTITVTGAALDPDGGYIGGVEFSADGGKTWTTTSGTSNWSFSWTAPSKVGLETLLYRSGDDAFNLEIANALTLKIVDPSAVSIGSAPQSSAGNLSNGQKIASGEMFHVVGTANDIDGTVTKIEVSTDHGYTWIAAAGTNNWSFDWGVPDSSSVHSFQYRALDSDHNVEAVHTVLVQAIDPLLV